MLKASDTDIESSSAAILSAGYDVAFLVPTETAMKKGIIDAHHSARAFLKRNEIHDYSTQPQGGDYKKVIIAQYITLEETQERKVSMYRPPTKNGDPRIWIYGLDKLASAYNLLALICLDNQLYIVNCSNKADLEYALLNTLPKPTQIISNVAKELLYKLREISSLGFTPSLRAGDTGVGMTLETLLGIAANSNKAPDYKGIELKATRISKRGGQKNKNQLFSKTPNWKLSPMRNAENLVTTRGYIDPDGLQALRHTVSGDKPNSLGLYLDIDYANSYLRQMFSGIPPSEINPVHDMTWILDDLKNALRKKHNETFWVKARHNNDRANEQFHYVEVEHTSKPYIDKLETLIETGLITMDYTLHIKPSGKVRDHGYLFKLKSNGIEALFPRPARYDLTT